MARVLLLAVISPNLTEHIKGRLVAKGVGSIGCYPSAQYLLGSCHFLNTHTHLVSLCLVLLKEREGGREGKGEKGEREERERESK